MSSGLTHQAVAIGGNIDKLTTGKSFDFPVYFLTIIIDLQCRILYNLFVIYTKKNFLKKEDFDD